MNRFKIAFALMAGLFFSCPNVLDAQSCCVATGNYNLNSVGRCQKGVLASKLEYGHSMGSFDSDGTFQWDNRASQSSWTQYIGAGYAFLYPHLEMGFNIPVVLSQNRKISEEDHYSYMLKGDINLSANLIVLNDLMTGIFSLNGESWKPFMSLNVGVKIPTGISSQSSQNWSQSDVTSNGYFQLNTSLLVSKFVTPKWVVGLNANYSLVKEKTIAISSRPNKINPGDIFGGSLSLSYIKNLWWSFYGFASLSKSTENKINGSSEPNSDNFSSLFGLSITRSVVVPFWQLQLGVETNPWFDGFGKNKSFSGYKTNITLRRNFI